MPVYDVQSFDINYCQADVEKILTAVKSRSSLLAIGMPGCGKSRLMNFIFSRPDVLQKYGLSPSIKSVRIDADALTSNPRGMYTRMLRALNAQVPARGDDIEQLREQLIAEVEALDEDVTLVMIFDNFVHQIQDVLGESFFNFLYALRNVRPNLNLSAIYMANLNIDRKCFYKAERMFDGGIDHSTCWLSLMNYEDTLFSIERQWLNAGYARDYLSEQDKEKIFKLSGGHALLNRHLSHLALEGLLTNHSNPAQWLGDSSIRAVCQSIWNDCNQNQKNMLIDVVQEADLSTANRKTVQELQNYGVITTDFQFFSPIYGRFVAEHQKSNEILSLQCNDAQTTLTLLTVDHRHLHFSLDGLPAKKRTLLCYLVTNHGETCTKDQLKDAGSPLDETTHVTDQALDRQIEDIKKWLKQRKQLNQYISIESIWGVGRKLSIVS